MNLLYFTALILHENPMGCGPSYVLEKWNKYIGIELKDLDTENYFPFLGSTDTLNTYIKKWHISDGVFKEMKGIFHFIFSNAIFDVETILRMYKTYIGDLSKINNEFVDTNGIHPNLLKAIEEWLSKPNNKSRVREFKFDDLIDE